MNRRQFIVGTSAGLATFATRRVWAQPANPPQASWKDLRGGVGIFSMQGGTIGWYASPDGVVVVDSQYAQTAPVCIEGLTQKSPHAIDLLINTHHHGDHTGGNKAFQPLVKHIVAHEKVPALQKAVAGREDRSQPGVSWHDVRRPEATIAEETVQRALRSGHTGGDSHCLQRANVMHAT
jgi:glyoxylase-like metal-dependent hydrolase (beta-lactamase superfamily II)